MPCRRLPSALLDCVRSWRGGDRVRLPGPGLQGRDEAVSLAGYRLDVARTGSGIAQRFANLVNRRVQAVIKVHEGVGRPELLLQLFASHDLSGALEQQREDLKGLALEAHSYPTFAQFAGRKVDLEDSESQDSANILGSRHGTTP